MTADLRWVASAKTLAEKDRHDDQEAPVEHMDHSAATEAAFSWGTAGALLMLAWAAMMWGAVAVLWMAYRKPLRPWQFWTSAGVVLLGMLGQIGHFQEHVAQVGYWVGHSQAQPWMTPLGTGLAEGMGRVNTSNPGLGMEILHLVGNSIFLTGLVGVVAMTRLMAKSRARTWGRMGVWMQGIHGLEHLALTVSVAVGSHRAIGLSTWFGLLDPGPGLWTYRIWWHFVANALGSTVFAIALFHLWRERATVRASFGIADPGYQPVQSPVDLPSKPTVSA